MDADTTWIVWDQQLESSPLGVAGAGQHVQVSNDTSYKERSYQSQPEQSHAYELFSDTSSSIASTSMNLQLTISVLVIVALIVYKQRNRNAVVIRCDHLVGVRFIDIYESILR